MAAKAVSTGRQPERLALQDFDHVRICEVVKERAVGADGGEQGRRDRRSLALGLNDRYPPRQSPVRERGANQ